MDQQHCSVLKYRPGGDGPTTLQCTEVQAGGDGPTALQCTEVQAGGDGPTTLQCTEVQAGGGGWGMDQQHCSVLKYRPGGHENSAR